LGFGFSGNPENCRRAKSRAGFLCEQTHFEQALRAVAAGYASVQYELAPESIAFKKILYFPATVSRATQVSSARKPLKLSQQNMAGFHATDTGASS